jgi:hypothetical protein
MNPRQFLQTGGAILIVLGVVGYLVPMVGTLITFSPWENHAHTVLGVVALIAVQLFSGDIQKWLVALVGVVALYFGVIGFMVAGGAAPNYYGIVQLDNPVDNLLHLVVGAWALFAAFGGKKGAMMA